MDDSRIDFSITVTNANSNFYGMFGPLWSGVKLEARQRPLKWSRLGKRKRREWHDEFDGYYDAFYERRARAAKGRRYV